VIFLGQIDRVDDPLKLGRAKIVVPAFGTDKSTDWAWRLQLPGVYFGPKAGQNVLVIQVASNPQDTLFWLGPIDAAPNGEPTTPRAGDFDQETYPKQKIIDYGFAEILADETGQQLIISTLPSGSPARITLDANVPQITINPGGADVLFDRSGNRLAMVGDDVVVDLNTGTGTIISGSVPAQARFVY